MTVRLIEHIPAHGPRGAAFEAAKKRMKALGLNKCAIQHCDTGAPIEYHHTYIEHSLQGGVDVDKLNKEFGLHLTDEEFAAWVQSPGNLEPLCSIHHRTQLGVHVLPEPLWNAVRVWKDDMQPPAELESANNGKTAGRTSPRGTEASAQKRSEVQDGGAGEA